MQATRDLTQVLYVAAVAPGRTRDAEEVVRVAIAETQRAAGVEAVALHLLDSGRDRLILREYAGTTPAFREQMAVLPLSEAVLAAAAIREQRVAGRTVDDHPTSSLRDLYAAQGFRNVTVVPVAGRDQILGVLHLASRNDKALTSEETALVQAIGGLVGVALENAALRERMTAHQDRLRALAGSVLQAREEEAYRRFAYAHTLPEAVDPEKVRATLTNGILEVRMPASPKVAGKKIPVEVGAGEAQKQLKAAWRNT